MPSNNYDLRNVTLEKLKREAHCTTCNKAQAKGRQKRKDEKGREKKKEKNFNL